MKVFTTQQRIYKIKLLKRGIIIIKKILIMILCLVGVGQASESPKDYNETANQLLKNAVKSSDFDQVKQAFAMGANPNYLQSRLDAPFNQVIMNSKSPEIFQCFIDNGVDVNFKADGNGTYPSALATVVSQRRLYMVEMLINAGADPNFSFEGETREGIIIREVTVIFLAVRSDEPISLNILKLLIEKGASINKKDSLGDTPLIIACSLGNLESVKILLTNGANPNTANYESKKPLNLAIKSGNEELINLLIPLTN